MSDKKTIKDVCWENYKINIENFERYVLQFDEEKLEILKKIREANREKLIERHNNKVK